MAGQTVQAPGLPPAWFKHAFWKVHRWLHRLSGGRFLWTPGGRRGWGAMRLTTTGRRSGRPRTVIIGYLDDDGVPFTLAMNGWDEGHPAWWLNLERNPRAEVRLPHRTPHTVRARAVEGAERDRLWRRWVDLEPDTERFASLRSVTTPVVIFEPLS